MVVFALVWASVAVPQSHANRTTGAKKTQKKSVAALQGDLGAIKKKKSVIRHELNQTKAAARVVKTDILIVDQRLDRLRSEVEDTERDLSISVSRQRELAKDVKEATAQVEVLRNRVRMRLKAIYLQGDQQVISALVGAKTVGELVSRASMMEAIAKQDRELFRDYETLSKRLKSKKLAQDAQVGQTRRLQ